MIPLLSVYQEHLSIIFHQFFDIIKKLEPSIPEIQITNFSTVLISECQRRLECLPHLYVYYRAPLSCGAVRSGNLGLLKSNKGGLTFLKVRKNSNASKFRY